MHRPVTIAVLVCLITSAPFSLGAQPRKGASAELRFLGAFEDRVSQGARAAPDGKPDGHFRLVLESAIQRRVLHALLRTCDPRGVITGRAAWDTDAARLWVLGVFRAGKALTGGAGKSLDAFQGRAVYDLYASAPLEGFRPGHAYCALVTFDDGMGVSARAIIGAPVPMVLRWVGADKDRVGRGDKDKPDGMPDGHFALTLNPGARRVRLTSLRLVEVGPDGKPLPGQRWSSDKNPTAILGVERGGRRLNWGGRHLADELTGAVDYDLWAAPRLPFREGARYRVVAGFAGDPSAFAVASVTRPPRPITGPVTVGLSYQGFAGDQVGTGARGGPDGQKDARLALSLDTSGRELTVTAVELSVSDDKGNTWRKTWDTRPGGHWILGVEREGKRLNPTDVPVQMVVTGKTEFTLWAANDAWKDPVTGVPRSFFSSGGFLTARVFLSSHPMVRQTIRLP